MDYCRVNEINPYLAHVVIATIPNDLFGRRITNEDEIHRTYNVTPAVNEELRYRIAVSR